MIWKKKGEAVFNVAFTYFICSNYLTPYYMDLGNYFRHYSYILGL